MIDGWELLPLGEIAPARSLPLPPADALVWNLSLEDIESGTGRVTARQSTRVDELGSAKCVFDERHVLYSKLRPYLNKVVVPDAAGVGTSELIPLCPDRRIDREYLAYYLRSPTFLDFASANTRGANLPRIAMAELWSHRVPVPPSRDEQRRVVARIKECMERVEEIEGLRDKAISEAAHIEFAHFHDALIEGIQQRGWPVLTLGEVAKSFRYGTSVKAHSHAEGLPVIRMSNLRDGRLDLSDLKYVDLPDAEVARQCLAIGDVLINRTNSLELVGKAATFDVAEGTWVCASYLVRVRVDRERAMPEFVSNAINSSMGREYVLRTARRAIGMVNLNAKEMAHFPMPVPPLAEQKDIVARLKAASALAEELRTSLEDSGIGFLRQSILHKAFAGKL
jgi:type I restriction enzyme, S subunit